MRESAQSFGVDSRQRMNIRAGCSQKGRESRRGRGRRERLGDFSPRLTSSCSAFRLLERNKRPPQSVYETTRRDASRRANKRTNDRFYNFPLSLSSPYVSTSIHLSIYACSTTTPCTGRPQNAILSYPRMSASRVEREFQGNPALRFSSLFFRVSVYILPHS